MLATLKDYSTVVVFTDTSQTIAAYNAVTRNDLSLSSVIPSGYKAIMATSQFVGGYTCYCYGVTVTGGNKLTYQIRNVDASQRTVTPSFQILCVRA